MKSRIGIKSVVSTSLSASLTVGAFGALALVAAASGASCGGTSGSDPAGEAGVLDASVSETAEPRGACAPPKTACGASCVDTKTDVKSCGACSNACQSGEACAAGTCAPVTANGFAARTIYLGETDRTGKSVKDAWKMYGRNIDGIVSVGGTPKGECKLRPGASAKVHDDGNSGIDNSWGKNILAFFMAITPTPSKTMNTAIEGGARTPMLELRGPPRQDIAAFALGLVTAENASSAPQWNGSDSRPVAEAWTTAGKAKVIFPNAKISGGVLASGDSTAPFVFSFGATGSAIEIPVRLAQVEMTLSADGKTATNGTLSGVIGTEEMVAAFDKSAGAISPQLCGGSTLDTIHQTIRNSSDILIDGTQDPNADCNAISFGIGFDAVAVSVGAIAGPITPPKDPCGD
jgi:hypothetical protein